MKKASSITSLVFISSLSAVRAIFVRQVEENAIYEAGGVSSVLRISKKARKENSLEAVGHAVGRILVPVYSAEVPVSLLKIFRQKRITTITAVMPLAGRGTGRWSNIRIFKEENETLKGLSSGRRKTLYARI